MKNLLIVAAFAASLISHQSMACETGDKDKSKLEKAEEQKQSKQKKQGEKTLNLKAEKTK